MQSKCKMNKLAKEGSKVLEHCKFSIDINFVQNQFKRQLVLQFKNEGIQEKFLKAQNT